MAELSRTTSTPATLPSSSCLLADLASLHRLQGLLLWIRLATGLAPGCVCVKANEAGLAARAARVRSKVRGAAAGPSAAKENHKVWY
jgi:hypothetical protein